MSIQVIVEHDTVLHCRGFGAVSIGLGCCFKTHKISWKNKTRGAKSENKLK